MKSTPETFREKIIKKIPLVIGRSIKMEKMESFIPMPQTNVHDDIIETLEMKDRIKKLEETVAYLSRRLQQLEVLFYDHESYYDHRSLGNE